MQLDRWLRSLDLTSVLTPSEVERKRVTSFMHSLNPALYLLRTLASAESAAGGKTGDGYQRHARDSVALSRASDFTIFLTERIKCIYRSSVRAAGSLSASLSSPGCLLFPTWSVLSSA